MITLASVVSLLVLLVILGASAWLISKAPFLNETFKQFIVYILLVIGVIEIIIFLLENFH